MTKRGLPAIHPGEYLGETLGELNIPKAEFARAIGVSPMRISHVIKAGVKNLIPVHDHLEIICL